MKLSKNELREKLKYILPSIIKMPFYRKKYNLDLLDESSAMECIIENFYTLPLISKEELLELTCVFQNKDSYKKLFLTGGTSGVSGIVTWADEDIALTSKHFANRLKSMGLTLDTYAFSAIGVEMSLYGVIVENIVKECGMTHIEFGRITNANSAVAHNLLSRFKPKVFFSTPMGILELLDNPELKDVLQCVEIVVIAGAIASHEDIQKIENSLNCKVFDVIGSTEFGLYGEKYINCSGFHLYEDVAIFEEKDEHIIMSTLANSHFPIVRYLSGDLGHYSNSCSCGYKGLCYTLTGRVSETCYIGGTKVDVNCFIAVTKAINANTTFQVLIHKNEKSHKIELNILGEETLWSKEDVLNSLLDTNVALHEKIATGMIEFNISFARSAEDFIGLNARGKWKRLLEV